MKVLVRGPALTRTGYGEHCRFVLRCLRGCENLDLYLIPVNWGQSTWVWEDTEERQWLDSIIKKTALYGQQGGKYDMSVQVTIPNEWQKMAPINVGVTAGIETTKVAPGWLQKCNEMDKIVTISNHSKDTFLNTFYEGIERNTGQKATLKCLNDVHVVHYPVKKYESLPDLNLDLPTKFNFLTVAQWGPRKNLHSTISWFVEEFIDNPEMHSLYENKSINALVSLTHGEGFGLPLFEAAYSGLPVIATDWSGHVDFLYMNVKDEKGRERRKPHFARVDYELNTIPDYAVWEGVLQKDSMWAYPQQGSFKMRLREVYKDHGRFKKQAGKLKKWLESNFTFEQQSQKMIDNVVPKDAFEIADWLNELENEIQVHS